MASSGFLLPLEPRGLYREMLTQAWLRGARLPNDEEAIQRAVAVKRDEWRRCWPVVKPYWRVDGAYLVNDTQLDVYAEAQGMAQRASNRGKKGAQARARASPEQCSSDAQVVLERCSSGTQVMLKDKPPSPSPSPSVRTERVPIARARGLSPGDNPELAERAGRFLERYGVLHEKWRHGAVYMGRIHVDFDEALQLVAKFDDERLDKLATVFLNADSEFAEKGTRSVPKFRSMVSWCDERLREKGL